MRSIVSRTTTLNALFFAVVVIEIGVLIWALRASAKDGGTYGRQVGRGLLISVVGGLIIIASSLIFTLVAFPRYFEELKALQAELKLPERPDVIQTPLAQALAGFAGTVITGLLASLLISLVARKK